MTAGDIEARVRYLEDIEALKRLQAKLVYTNDDGDWQGLANLFVVDGIGDFGPFGLIEGRQKIGEFFKALPASLPFRFHMLHNPLIEINGDKATARWAFQASTTQSPANRACWIAGEYITDCVRVGGEWKFKRVANKFHYITPFDEGWVKTKMC